jgi:excisionase family DNA binding protein
MDDELLTTAEAGAVLGVDASRVRQLVAAGAITIARRIRGAILVPRLDVERYAATRRRPGWRKGRPRKPTPKGE